MSSRILQITLSIMAASMVCKITGLIREISLASYLGISKYTDAYLISSAIPSEIFNVLFASAGIIFLPLYIEVLEREGKQKALLYMNNLINVMLLISIVVCVLGLIFTKPLVKLMAAGFNDDLISITVEYTRIILPAIIALGISNILSAYLQANNNFIIPGLRTVPTNIIVIMSTFLCIYYDSTILAFGTLLGLISQLLLQIPIAYKKGYRYKFFIKFNDIKLISTMKMIMPVFIGSSIQQVNNFVDRIIASTLFIGSVATLNFAHKIDMLIFGLFSLSFSTVIYRKLSECIAKDNMKSFSEIIIKALSVLTMLLIPITILTMQLSEQIVTIIYKRGSFDDSAVAITSITLYFYAIGILGFGIRDILSKAFYSLKNTKTPLVNGSIAVSINIVLSLILVRSMGIGGIALATSISSIITTLLLLISIRKILPEFRLDFAAYNMIKILLSSGIAGIFMQKFCAYVSCIFSQNITGRLLELVCCGILFATIYIPLLKLMKVKGLDILIESTKVLVRDSFGLNLK